MFPPLLRDSTAFGGEPKKGSPYRKVQAAVVLI